MHGLACLNVHKGNPTVHVIYNSLFLLSCLFLRFIDVNKLGQAHPLSQLLCNWWTHACVAPGFFFPFSFSFFTITDNAPLNVITPVCCLRASERDTWNGIGWSQGICTLYFSSSYITLQLVWSFQSCGAEGRGMWGRSAESSHSLGWWRNEGLFSGSLPNIYNLLKGSGQGMSLFASDGLLFSLESPLGKKSLP